MTRSAALGFALIVAVTLVSAREAVGQTVPQTASGRMEARVLDRVNKARTDKGLAKLRADARLSDVAREYSCRMARDDVFGHTSPTGGTLRDRVRAAGYTYAAAGENLAKTVNARYPIERAVQGWLKSEGHRNNIMSPEFTVTGVGVCHRETTYYFTQIFLRPQ